MLQAAIGQKEELFSTKEFRLKCDDRLLVFCAEMQETENIWHAEPKVAEICNSGAYYNLEHAFLPIFFVALLAELEKGGEEATRKQE